MKVNSPDKTATAVEQDRKERRTKVEVYQEKKLENNITNLASNYDNDAEQRFGKLFTDFRFGKY